MYIVYVVDLQLEHDDRFMQKYTQKTCSVVKVTNLETDVFRYRNLVYCARCVCTFAISLFWTLTSSSSDQFIRCFFFISWFCVFRWTFFSRSSVLSVLFFFFRFDHLTFSVLKLLEFYIFLWHSRKKKQKYNQVIHWIWKVNSFKLPFELLSQRSNGVQSNNINEYVYYRFLFWF